MFNSCGHLRFKACDTDADWGLEDSLVDMTSVIFDNFTLPDIWSFIFSADWWILNIEIMNKWFHSGASQIIDESIQSYWRLRSDKKRDKGPLDTADGLPIKTDQRSLIKAPTKSEWSNQYNSWSLLEYPKLLWRASKYLSSI